MTHSNPYPTVGPGRHEVGRDSDTNGNVYAYDHVVYTKMVTQAFWDANLKESGEARAYLASNKLPLLSQGTLQLQRK